MVLQITQQMSPNQFDLWRESGVPDVASATRKAVDVSVLNMELEKAKAMFPIELHVAKMKSELADLDLARARVENSSEMLDLLAQDTKLGFQQNLQSKKNAMQIQANASDFMLLDTLAQTNPDEYLQKRKALGMALLNNPEAQAMLNQKDIAFDQLNFVNKDGSTEKGAFIRLNKNANAMDFTGTLGLSRAQEADAVNKDMMATQLNDFVRSGASEEEIAEFKNVRKEELKQKSRENLNAMKNALALAPLKEKQTQAQQDAFNRALKKPIGAGGLSDELLSKTGHVGDTDANTMMIEALKNVRETLQDEAGNRGSKYTPGEIKIKLDKIALLEKQVDTFGFGWFNWAGGALSRKWRADWNRDFYKVDVNAEVEAYKEIRDLAAAGKKKEAFAKMNDLIMDQYLDKDFAEVVMRSQILSAMEPAHPSTDQINDQLRSVPIKSAAQAAAEVAPDRASAGIGQKYKASDGSVIVRMK